MFVAYDLRPNSAHGHHPSTIIFPGHCRLSPSSNHQCFSAHQHTSSPRSLSFPARSLSLPAPCHSPLPVTPRCMSLPATCHFPLHVTPLTSHQRPTIIESAPIPCCTYPLEQPSAPIDAHHQLFLPPVLCPPVIINTHHQPFPTHCQLSLVLLLRPSLPLLIHTILLSLALITTITILRLILSFMYKEVVKTYIP
jgi:hypothetical protein